MVLKRKTGGTSSESSSSSSSSSSTSSSSSSNENSGSDSSSSDSETSSSDRKSSDSETRRSRKSASPVKKKTPPRSNKPEPKVEPKPVNNVKSKNFTTCKMSAIYSSESDDDKSKRRMSTSKGPKSTATITPNVSKPTAKPKATASSVVNSKKIESKRLSSSSLKQAQSSKADAKTKTKSIFSPDNSSESDTQTPPPPKLTPMKNVPVTSAAKSLIKSKLKTTPVKKESGSASEKSRTSSVSSRSSMSSESSSDSEESTPAPSVTPQKTSPPPPKTSTPVTPLSDTSPKKKGRGRPRKNPLPNSEQEPRKPGAVKKAEPKTTHPSGPKKATRSGTTRTSKLLSGVISIKVQSDSESDSEKKKSALAKMKRPVGRPRKENGKKSNEASSVTFPEEERKCPVENCDSSGHLCGKYDVHFTKEACPVYHNLTPQQCKENASKWKKGEEDRRKALMLLKPSSMLLSAEQKAYREHVKEIRKELIKDAGAESQENIVPNPLIHEPNFIPQGVPKFDHQLFLNAQAVAAEKIELDLKSLPCYKGTKCVEMGKFEMEVWYQSPYPEQFQRFPKLYLCEFCLKYMSSRTTLSRHTAKCVWKHPPGQQVYRKDKISVWEVDGKKYKQYCQHLCLLAKFFLDHKTLYYDVEPFLFYIMTTSDSEGCHTIGYFSKEKNSFLNYNVSCILTLPPYQRQGFGRLLIDFSYLLTRTEGKVGSPEKPLSDLGLISYRSYWKDVLLEYLCNLENKQLSIKDMSQELAVNSYDIVSTLQALGMMKYWKGKHIILKKQDVIEEYVERVKRRGSNYKEIDAKCLKWTPPTTNEPS